MQFRCSKLLEDFFTTRPTQQSSKPNLTFHWPCPISPTFENPCAIYPRMVNECWMLTLPLSEAKSNPCPVLLHTTSLFSILSPLGLHQLISSFQTPYKHWHRHDFNSQSTDKRKPEYIMRHFCRLWGISYHKQRLKLYSRNECPQDLQAEPLAIFLLPTCPNNA